MVLEFEVIIFLLQLDDFAVSRIESAIRPAVFFGQKGFFLGRIKAPVDRFVKMSLGVAASVRIACTTCLWRASVVRTKSSLVRSSLAAKAFQSRASSSQ